MTGSLGALSVHSGRTCSNIEGRPETEAPPQRAKSGVSGVSGLKAP